MTANQIAQQIQTAEGFLELGEPEQAWELLEDLPGEFHPVKEVLHLRLRILLALKEWFKAGFMAESLVIHAEPENAQLWYSFAIALAQQGKIPEAKTALQNAFQFDEGLRGRATKDDLLLAVW